MCCRCLDQIVKTCAKRHCGGVGTSDLSQFQVSILPIVVHLCASTHDVVGQVVHHVPVWDLPIFGSLLSELREEICSSCPFALLVVVPVDFVFGDLCLRVNLQSGELV